MSQRDRLERRRDRLFMAFGHAGIEYPALISGVLAILCVIGAVLATQLTITTSRSSLVAHDNWYQQRIVTFHEQFGHHDSPVAIVSGGTVEQRRAAVDALSAELEREAAFRGRVLGRVEAEDVAGLLMVQAPGQLAQFRQQLPPSADLPAALEQGLEGIFGLLEQQLLGALDGELEVDPNQADAQLPKLAALARALDAKLAFDAGQGEEVDTQALLDTLVGEQGGALFDEQELLDRGIDEEGYFVSNDGERLLLVAFPDFASDRDEDFRPAVERMRAIAEAVELEHAPVDFILTGLPFINVDEQDELSRGMPRASVAAGLGIFLLLLLVFRSIRRASVALLPIAAGTVVSLGALYLLYGELDMVTSTFAAVLMGLGIDFSVHLLARYDEDLRRDHSRRVALFSSLRKAGPGVVTGALTTALAFLTIATTEFTSYGNMGVITAIGLMVALLSALFLLPVLLGRGDLEAGEEPPRQLNVDFLGSFARRAPLLIVLAAIVFACIGVSATPSYNPRFLQLLGKEAESSQGLDILERDGAMTPWFAWVTSEDLEQARRDTESLRALGTVARVDSPTDLLPELDGDTLDELRADFEGLARDPDWSALAERERDPAALAKRALAIADALDELAFAAEGAGRDVKAIEATAAAFGALRKRLESTPEQQARATLGELESNMAKLLGPAWTSARTVAARGHWTTEDLPAMFQRRFVAKDGSGRVAIYVYPAGDVTSGEDGNIAAKRFVDELESIDPNTAGQGVSLYYHNRMILQGFKRAAFFSLCLVIVLLILDFGSLRKAFLTLFPVLLGMGWMVGIMALLELRLNVGTIVVMPLTLGIGIDAGVHMMHRAALNARARGGRADIMAVVSGTGGAVVLSSLTTIIGFAGLLLGRHLAMIQLGLSMVIGIACALVASVVVLPALLVLLDHAE